MARASHHGAGFTGDPILKLGNLVALAVGTALAREFTAQGTPSDAGEDVVVVQAGVPEAFAPIEGAGAHRRLTESGEFTAVINRMHTAQGATTYIRGDSGTAWRPTTPPASCGDCNPYANATVANATWRNGIANCTDNGTVAATRLVVGDFSDDQSYYASRNRFPGEHMPPLDCDMPGARNLLWDEALEAHVSCAPCEAPEGGPAPAPGPAQGTASHGSASLSTGKVAAVAVGAMTITTVIHLALKWACQEDGQAPEPSPDHQAAPDTPASEDSRLVAEDAALV
jgi:hypothetical protein